MRILVVAPEYYPHGGGIANRVWRTVEGLEGRGFTCSVCSPTGPDVALGGSHVIRKLARIGIALFWWRACRYWKAHRTEYDLVWLNNPLLLWRTPFGRCVVTVDSTAYGHSVRRIHSWLRHLYYQFWAWIEGRSFRSLARNGCQFVALTEHGTHELVGLGVPMSAVIEIGNGVDLQTFCPMSDKPRLRMQLGLAVDVTVFVFAASLTEVKNPQALLDVLQLVSSRVPFPITLLIAGDGPMRSGLEARCAANGLHNVRFLGRVPHETELPAVLQSSDYFILTSRYEGLPLAILEAMACGLPVIVPQLPSLTFVDRVGCGIRVDFDRLEDAADQIAAYIQKGSTADGRQGRAYAEQCLAWDRVAQQYVAAFQHSVGRL